MADNNEKITRLKEEIQTLRDEVALSSEEHKVETDRLEKSTGYFQMLFQLPKENSNM